HVVVTAPADDHQLRTLTSEEPDKLVEWILGKEVTLRYIYLSHGHFDHWISAGYIAGHFPGVQIISAPEVKADIESQRANGESFRDQWAVLFQEPIPPAETFGFEVLTPERNIVRVGDYEFSIHSVGHSDGDDTTVLHVAPLNLVVAGDVVYNNVHQMFAEAPGGGFAAWRSAIDLVESLEPEIIIAGHRDYSRSDEAGKLLAETRDYLGVAERVLATENTREGIFRAMTEAFPGRLNPFVPLFCADILLQSA
ncbi:MBL fold metallo-hydrolase, partial [Gordonia humi]